MSFLVVVTDNFDISPYFQPFRKQSQWPPQYRVLQLQDVEGKESEVVDGVAIERFR